MFFHAQILSQNGHTLWSMWTLRSNWPFKKPHFHVMLINEDFLQCQYGDCTKDELNFKVNVNENKVTLLKFLVFQTVQVD
jgi:hypothetical protein